MKIIPILIVIGFRILPAAGAADALLNNSGFEARSFSGWNTTGKGWSIDDTLVSEGEVSALCHVQKNAQPELRACVQRLKVIEEEKIVEVSMDLSARDVAASPNSKACLAVLCVDEDGNMLKEYRSSVVKPQPSFERVTIDDAVVLPGTRQVYIMLVVEVYQVAESDDFWRFDHVQVQIH